MKYKAFPIILVLLFSSMITLAINSPLLDNSFATVVGNKNIFDYDYTFKYIKNYKYLSSVDYKDLNERSKTVFLKVGNANTLIKGFILNEKKYAIHLVACIKEKGYCNFRVNGVLAKGLSEGSIFDLNENYAMRVNSIQFDQCDNRRICDYYYQSYDLAEVEVVEK